VSFPVRARVKARVVLILYRNAAYFLAAVEEDSRADDLRWAFQLRTLTPLGRPLEVSRLQALLRKGRRRPLESHGDLTDKASEVVLDALLAEDPRLDSVIGTLFGIRDIDLPAPRKEAMAEQRDTLASLCAFTGAPGLLPADGFLTEDEIGSVADRDSLLPAMPGIPPREDSMIEHDANTFLGWTPQPSDRLAVRIFNDGDSGPCES
jgi:hypothetical protein